MWRYLILMALLLVGFFIWEIPQSVVDDFFVAQKNTSELANNESVEQVNEIIESEIKNVGEDKVEKDLVIDTLIDNKVPFTSQAPLGDWKDERQQDGCEEASALMAIYWAQDKNLNKLTAWQKITDLSDYQQKNYGEYRDIALEDVINRIFKDYFQYDKVELKQGIKVRDLINELNKGHIVLAPMDGQKLNNPYFTPPGPERHMLVIKGYDPITKEFITNDPGTKRGENYRYNEDLLFKAIRAYPTGYHEPIKDIKKEVIIFWK